MKDRKNKKAAKGILTFVIAMLLISGALRLGSVGLAFAEGAAGHEANDVGDAPQQTCATDTETQELMDILKARSERVAAVEEEQAKREARLEEAKAEVLANLQRVEAAEARLSETIQTVDGAASEDVNRLTAVYESMKPKDAALLFEQMTPEFAAGFLGEMPPNAAAGILSGLSSEKAYAVSVVLAGRNASAPKK